MMTEVGVSYLPGSASLIEDLDSKNMCWKKIPKPQNLLRLIFVS